MASRDFSYGSTEIDVDKVLGVGSYGKVCKAKCGQLPCAAKLLHDTFFQDNDPGTNTFVRRFEQECQFLSNIKHPNIVQYLGTTSDPKSHRPVLLMELMDESLTRFLERSTLGLPYHSQLNICHDIALALAYLHSNTIIHRDLSSNNVLLIGEGSRAKVTDFGMSKLTEMNPCMTPLTQCPGTSVYMPPEALSTPPHYSNKLDIFSHGVLTIQIITRNFPNPGDANIYVDDPKYPTGRVLVHFPEADRRKKDIDLIEADHPLLPTAVHCIKDRDRERPSANELCEGLASLKSSARYRDSMEQTREQTLSSQRLQLELEAKEQELQRERGELQREREDHQEELQREREDRQEELQREREDHQGELQREREDHQRELQREREDHQRELEQVIEEYQEQYQQEIQKEKNSLKTEKERLTVELRDSQAREQQYREELEAMRSQTALRGVTGPKKIEAIGNKVSLNSERSTAIPAKCGLSVEGDYCLATTKVLPRPADEIMKKKLTCIKEGHPAIYQLPMTTVYANSKDGLFKYHIGTPPAFPVPERVLMMVGATGAGKSTLIDRFANYIYGVNWKDDFQFKIIVDESSQSQAYGQTKHISVYSFYSTNLNYTLTIIDTPGFGDTRGIERDKKIAKQIKLFFTEKQNGIDQLHGIGFVTQASLALLTPAQKYIFDAVLSIYGKDIEENIFLMSTFANANTPPVIDALKEADIPYIECFKFNNSALFTSSQSKSVHSQFNSMFWDMGNSSFETFFEYFSSKVSPKSLALTREVLQERERLELLIPSLQEQVRMGLSHYDEIRQEERQRSQKLSLVGRSEWSNTWKYEKML